MNIKKYYVLQGNFTKSGTGDYWNEGEFDTLEEAQKRMYEIYDNMDGISKQPNGYLETLIIREKTEIDEDKELDEDDEYEIVDGMVYYY